MPAPDRDKISERLAAARPKRELSAAVSSGREVNGLCHSHPFLLTAGLSGPGARGTKKPPAATPRGRVFILDILGCGPYARCDPRGDAARTPEIGQGRRVVDWKHSNPGGADAGPGENLMSPRISGHGSRSATQPQKRSL